MKSKVMPSVLFPKYRRLKLALRPVKVGLYGHLSLVPASVRYISNHQLNRKQNGYQAMNTPFRFSSPEGMPVQYQDWATPTSGNNPIVSVANTDHNFQIPRSSLHKVFQGVMVATKTSEVRAEPIIRWISSCGTLRAGDSLNANFLDQDCSITTAAPSLRTWRTAIVSDFPREEKLQQLARLALGVTCLREKSRLDAPVTPTELGLVWELVHGALTNPLLKDSLSSASRSAQGFISVPLCSLLKDGIIGELFRLHVWLPDGQRGRPDISIHSHQPFAQSWVLAGEGKDHSYKIEPTTKSDFATHAEYTVSWSDGKDSDSTYRTIQTYSIIKRTERLVHATPIDSVFHSRDMSYTIPAAAFHSTEVPPDTLHATLFYFDSSREFIKDACILGPKNGESFTQLRDPGGVTPALLASKVAYVRNWEDLMKQGHKYAQQGELEEGLRAFNSALSLCESVPDFPNASRYRNLVLGEIGHTNRCFGRYEQAKDILEKTITEMGHSLQQVDFSGELGVVYRHMNRLADAKRTFKMQYDVAKELKYLQAACRAVGNLGMVNYQLSQQNNDDTLLDLAIQQLTERVQTARHMREIIDCAAIDPPTRGSQVRYATTREVIGLSRLSLCYAARGNKSLAVGAAFESLSVARRLDDPTVIAMSQFFYGRALLLDGQRDEAMRQFNAPGACAPAVALCKEPSEEHRHYLKELVKAGVDMDLVDDLGYSPLDYAVFNRDAATEKVLLESLRQTLTGDIEGQILKRRMEAKLRKGYRELFQENLRPVLLSSGVDGALSKLRRMYADALAADEEKRTIFDELYVVSYSDFLRFGKLPRSNDGLAQKLRPKSCSSHQDSTADFVIFFSYTRINRGAATLTPDDANHTIYQRMVQAAEQFLQLHPSVDRNQLKLWVVSY